MELVLVAITVVPLAATGCAAFASTRLTGWVTVGAGALSFGLVLVLVEPCGRAPVHVGFLRADALSVVFALSTAFLYLMTAIYSIGYLHAGHDEPRTRRYSRRFYLGLNVFAWSMLCAPLMNGLALLWVAIEITTVVSALLVAIENTDGATEAAWKYVLIASTGLGIALLATVFMYSAGASVLGSDYDLSFGPLLSHANQLPATPVRLAFVLAVLGFGTKVGLVPVHTWLPDAHAEAPTPVSALLSGSLLTVSLYAVIRYYEIASAAIGPALPRLVLLVFGVASLLLAALYLLDQRDIKRMLAYSSIEHMGILSIGLSFGAPVAAAGVLLHVLAHAAAKSGAFMGAGVFVRAFDTKKMSDIRNALGVLPWSGPLFLLLILGLSGFPPSGIFRSEFLIVQGGLASPHRTSAVILIALVTLAFVGLAVSTATMVCAPSAEVVVAAEPSVAMTVALGGCLLVLVWLGVHPPGALEDLLGAAADQISGVTS